MSSQLLEYIKQEAKKVLNEAPGAIPGKNPFRTIQKARKEREDAKASYAFEFDSELFGTFINRHNVALLKVAKEAKQRLKKLGGLGQKSVMRAIDAMIISANFLEENFGPDGVSSAVKAAGIDVSSMQKKFMDEVLGGGFTQGMRYILDAIPGEDSDKIKKVIKGAVTKRSFADANPGGRFIERADKATNKVANQYRKKMNQKAKAAPGEDIEKIRKDAADGQAQMAAAQKKKKSGRKRKRHPLRAKQERLSRRIKVPVAKIQDMLQPYFAGGGKLTFKESINRSIILEGDGAYGGETEAAIKAFQAQVNDLIEKGILKGVKPLGEPDGLFGPGSLRAFQALKKQPEALAQSKLGSAQVDPSTLAGGARQAAAQAAAGAGPQQPPADQGPPAPGTPGYTTLAQQKGVFGNSLKLLINAGGGSQTFTALQKVWQDSNIEDTPPPQKLLKLYGSFLVKNLLTPDTSIPNEAALKSVNLDSVGYIENVLWKQTVVDQLSNPNSAIGGLTARLFKTQDALQLFLKQPDDSVAKAIAPEKKKVEKSFFGKIDKDIKARKKTADNAATATSQAAVAADLARMQSYNDPKESKAYAYLEKLINEELDKILG